MDKLKFANINKDGSNRVNILEKKTDQYVKFGQYNSFPNDLIELYNNSSIHNTCINAIVDGDSSIIALGGWTGTTRVQFAVKPEEGCGLLFLLDSDWRDSDVKTTSSLNLMGDLIEDNFDF